MRNLILIIFLLGSFSLWSQQKKVSADSIVTFAKSQLGTSYKFGRCEPKKGFDCSGFVYYVFNHFGINVPRSSVDYENVGRKISLDSCKAGDVIVFTGTKPGKNRKPGHVGIIISAAKNEILFIHASSGKKNNGVIISNYSESPAYKKRFIKIVRHGEVQ